MADWLEFIRKLKRDFRKREATLRAFKILVGPLRKHLLMSLGLLLLATSGVSARNLTCAEITTLFSTQATELPSTLPELNDLRASLHPAFVEFIDTFVGLLQSQLTSSSELENLARDPMNYQLKNLPGHLMISLGEVLRLVRDRLKSHYKDQIPFFEKYLRALIDHRIKSESAIARSASTQIETHAQPLAQILVPVGSTIEHILTLSDGKHFMLGLGNGEIEVRLLPDGALVRKWNAHIGGVSALLMHPDGEHFLSGGDDGKIHLWNWKNGNRIHTYDLHTRSVRCFAMQSHGQGFFSSSWDGNIRHWRLQDPDHSGGRIVSISHANHMALNQDGSQLLIQGDDQLHLIHFNIHPSDGNPRRSQADNIVSINPQRDPLLEFDDLGAPLLLGMGDGTLARFHFAQFSPGTEPFELFEHVGHLRGFNRVRRHPGSRLVLTADIGTQVRIWDEVSMRHLVNFQPLPEPSYDLVLSPSSDFLISGGMARLLAITPLPTDLLTPSVKGRVATAGISP